MIREINKKKFLLENRKPYPLSIENYLREIWLSEWIYSSNKLSGSNLTLIETLNIIKGNCILEKTIEDHMFVRCHEEAIIFMEKMSGRKENISLEFINKMYAIMTNSEKYSFRNNNPVIQNIHHVPCHFKEIPSMMESMLDWYTCEGLTMNAVLRGTILHNKLITNYPYEKDNEKIARCLLNYELMKEGLPPIDFNMPAKSYFNMLSIYISKENISEFYELILQLVNGRMELFLSLTAGN